MPKKLKKTIIISLGGSLVVPGEVDIGFLKSFKRVLEKYLFNCKFFIIVGGGKTARTYQKAMAEFGAKTSDKDWIGIDATKMNAKIVRQVFAKQKIFVGGGEKPGNSTDYIAIKIAKKYKAKTIINLTNIDYVYDKNPGEFVDAKPFKEISWKNFQKLVGSKWIPGMNAPFDPRASKLAEKLRMEVLIINGKNLEGLEDFLNNKPFIGTIIK